MTTACDWCGTPMHGDYRLDLVATVCLDPSELLADQRHPGCGDPLRSLSTTVPAEALGPCAVCGTTTVRYGDTAPSTLCPLCCQDVTPRD